MNERKDEREREKEHKEIEKERKNGYLKEKIATVILWYPDERLIL
jgi:hypothetical protein